MSFANLNRASRKVDKNYVSDSKVSIPWVIQDSCKSVAKSTTNNFSESTIISQYPKIILFKGARMIDNSWKIMLGRMP